MPNGFYHPLTSYSAYPQHWQLPQYKHHHPYRNQRIENYYYHNSQNVATLQMQNLYQNQIYRDILVNNNKENRNRKKTPRNHINHDWIYEDPENYLIDNFMDSIRDNQIRIGGSAKRSQHRKKQNPGKLTEEEAPGDHDRLQSDGLSGAVNNKSDKLYTYLQSPLNTNTNLIRFRNPSSALSGNTNGPVTHLILKPVAKSIAGSDGKAIANPQSKAILRKGHNVDILFEPEAVAVAGAGGIAHAQSDLEILYQDYD